MNKVSLCHGDSLILCCNSTSEVPEKDVEYFWICNGCLRKCRVRNVEEKPDWQKPVFKVTAIGKFDEKRVKPWEKEISRFGYSITSHDLSEEQIDRINDFVDLIIKQAKHDEKSRCKEYFAVRIRNEFKKYSKTLGADTAINIAIKKIMNS